jgi:hypothetical protein
MPDLPVALENDAQDRWQKVTDALKLARLDWPATGLWPDEVRRAFVFSDYLTRQCIQRPGMWHDLMVSGDL